MPPDATTASPSRLLSLAALTLLDASPPELVACATAAGFGGVGVRLVAPSTTEVRRPMLGRTALVRRTKAALEDSPLRLVDVEIVRLTPQIQVRADVEALAETGAYLGASHLLVAGNDGDLGRTADNFAELAELGAEYGLTPNLEPMPWTAVADLATALDVLGRCGHDNVGLLVDAIHFRRAGESVAALADVPPRWLHYAQLCDAPAEQPPDDAELIRQAREDRLLPGEGGLQVAEIVDHLPNDLPLAVEAPFAAAVALPASERAKRAFAALTSLVGEA